MSSRSTVLANNEPYHIFNRTVSNLEIFTSKRILSRSLALLDFYRLPQTLRFSKFQLLPYDQKERYLLNIKNQTPLVEIFAFVFLPNHYHLLLRQLQDKGISRFISNFQNSLAKYYNLKNKRHGSAFQNPFKAKWVETEEEFFHLSRYIHLNPTTSFLIKIDKLLTYPWSSLSFYVEEKPSGFVQTDLILDYFKSGKKYYQFVLDNADYQKKLAEIKRLTFE